MTTQLDPKTVTAADVEAGLTQSWCYSDAYKEIYGSRPRGHTAAQEASFWNIFDVLWANMEAEEAADLAALGDFHDREFKNWAAYYDFLEEKREHEYREEVEARRVAAEKRREFFRRGSPVPYIQAWEHGDIVMA